MDNLPEETDRGRVVEAEVVGRPKPVPLWKRAAARVAAAGALALLGLVLIGAGAFLTLTVVGAVVGIPLALAGLGLVAAAAFLLLGGGTISIRTWPRGPGG